MATGTWSGRRKIHDEIGVPLVKERFAAQGFESFNFGVETSGKQVARTLGKQEDLASRMLRFRPDVALVRPGACSVLGEVKCNEGRHPNFAVELASYEAARGWHDVTHSLLYGFVDLAADNAGPYSVIVKGETHKYRVAGLFACWCDDVPPPARILVPRPCDFERISQDWPCANVHLIEKKGGSGTAFFLIPKRSPFLVGLDEFIRCACGISEATL